MFSHSPHMARASPLRVLTLLCAIVGVRAGLTGLWCDAATTVVDKVRSGCVRLMEIAVGGELLATRPSHTPYAPHHIMHSRDKD